MAVSLSSPPVKLRLFLFSYTRVSLIGTKMLIIFIDPCIIFGINTKVTDGVAFFYEFGKSLMLPAIVRQHCLCWLLVIVLKANVLLQSVVSIVFTTFFRVGPHASESRALDGLS